MCVCACVFVPGFFLLEGWWSYVDTGAMAMHSFVRNMCSSAIMYWGYIMHVMSLKLAGRKRCKRSGTVGVWEVPESYTVLPFDKM